MFRKYFPLVMIGFWGIVVFSLPEKVNAFTPLTRAVILKLRNFVQIMPKNQPQRPARKLDAMTPGDGLFTGKASLAELRFNDGSLARIGEQAVFHFLPKTRNFKLSNGTVLLLIPPKKGLTRVNTPNAAAAIRGSALFVRYDEKKDTTVVAALTNSGIEVFNKDASQRQKLKAGQLIVIVKGRFQGLYEFDLRSFYDTSDLVRGLDLARRSGPASDPAIAKVQAETAAAVSSQPPITGQGVVENPPFTQLSTSSSNSNRNFQSGGENQSSRISEPTNKVPSNTAEQSGNNTNSSNTQPATNTAPSNSPKQETNTTSSNSPKQETATSPKQETNTTSSNSPKQETNTAPSNSPKQETNTTSSNSPKQETNTAPSNSPKQETATSPKQETNTTSSNSPKQETNTTSSNSPKQETATSPKQETNTTSSNSPKQETNTTSSNSPKQETATSPKQETNTTSSNSPKQETATSPKQETNTTSSNSPKQETATSPKQETNTTSSNSPKQETNTAPSNSPKQETNTTSSNSPKQETATSPKQETATSPKQETNTAPSNSNPQ